MIEKGADNWNEGLRGACKRGNKEIVELMIEKGANNWNWGLRIACKGGNKEIVEMMIEKGADDWNEGRLFSSSIISCATCQASYWYSSTSLSAFTIALIYSSTGRVGPRFVVCWRRLFKGAEK